ncbi:MAG: ThuA domain-containing protein, partial [Ginsengibacter sp.]
MQLRKQLLLATVLLAFAASIFYACKLQKSVTSSPKLKPVVLVFIKTKGYHHASIPEGVKAIQQLGKDNNFDVDSTSDASYFTEGRLKQYATVIFLNTTMNVLNADQQVAFERFIQAGGGFAGVHAATDTEYDWPWYNRLVGAYFSSHPHQQKAVIDVKDTTHISTSFLPARWERFDEWYNFKNIQSDLKILATLDEMSYKGGTNNDNHPVAWYHSFDGGRAFYTALGHTSESYSEPLFLKHLLGGIQYAIGENKALDYSKSYAVKSPEDNRFTKTVLVNDLNEPMELAVAPDGRVFFSERAGKFYMYDPATQKTKLLRDFPAKAVDKYLNGLIGVTLDPDFKNNNWLYVFYSSSTGDQYHQNISRFTVNADNTLDTASEKIIIKIPIDLEVSAHTGGSFAWDAANNLYISTGDNTVPFESDGYAPMDERPGRHIYDAQRSAGNPNDLRGKILRIHPEENGTYTIPEGNLFAKGAAGTKPEIYVMGCRNPYRISVDRATSILYWGEVGPDAGTDSRHGPRGYDEFNQARKAGNYGWPFFVGDSRAYNDSDFASKAIGALFDLNGPTNNSPNNTGMKILPPPQKPMVWYAYVNSDEFPSLGQGGRCAMGGPVYNYNNDLPSATKLPAYYDKAFFVYDWMRNWVFAIRLDENQNYKRMEQFMPTNGDFRRPIDMEIGPEGSIYMLEYGSVYGIDNEDARLVRIDYNPGNRTPIAKITSKDTIGLAPLKVSLNSSKSIDYDEEDQLGYEWFIDGDKFSSEANPSYTFDKNGLHQAVLKITDPSGKSDSDTLVIKVGNTLPKVAVHTTDNSTFFFNKKTALHYDVDIQDNEDKEIDEKGMKISLRYIPKVAGSQAVAGHQLSEDYNLGKTLMASSDCKACHQMDAKSVGPSFVQVAKKYSGDKNAMGYLANKIITGGNGVWGEHAMNAHPQLPKEDASEIVKYVLSAGSKENDIILPQKGAVVLREHAVGEEQGRYFLTASYTDKGGAVTPLTSKYVLVLRPSKVEAEDADATYGLRKNQRGINNVRNGSFFSLKNIDLKDVQQLKYRYSSVNKDAIIEVHIDSSNGKTISILNYKATGARNKIVEDSASVTNPGGKHDLYFVFVKTEAPNDDLIFLDWVRFEGGIEAIEIIAPAETKKLAEKKPADKKEKGMIEKKPSIVSS